MIKSIFEKIADREIPGYIIWEDENHIAFLTIEPHAPGHTLVVSKINNGDDIFELTDENYQALLLASKKVGKILKEKMKTERVLMWVEGFEVAHVHIHLIPANRGHGITKPPVKASQEELKSVYDQIIK